MEDSAERWLDAQNFMDIQVFSTIGLEEDDITAIALTPGVAQVSAGYHTKVLTKRGDQEVSVQVLSLDSSDDAPLNTPDIINGRLPENDNECLVEEAWLRDTNSELGSTVHFYSGMSEPLLDTLIHESFTIVGVARSPLFIADDRGSSEVGMGFNWYFFLVLPEAFALDIFTTAYLQVDHEMLKTAKEHTHDWLLPKAAAPPDSFSSTSASEDSGGILSHQDRRLGNSRFESAYYDLVAVAINELEETSRSQNEERINLITQDAEAEIAVAREEIAQGYQKLNDTAQTFETARADLETMQTKLQGSWKTLERVNGELSTKRTDLDDGWTSYSEGAAQTEQAFAQGGLTEQQYERARLQLQASYAQLLAQEEAYRAAVSELEKGRSEYSAGVAEYNLKLANYEAALATFENERVAALADLTDAEEELRQSEMSLRSIELPNWYILDLQSNAGFKSFMQQSEQMESIATLLPLLFFLIAALVSMTSMTRLVDSDRTIIGSFKALGYTNRVITARYLIYALSASLFGGVLGFIIGINVLPPLIFNAFRTLFCVPPGPLYFTWPLAILAIVVALIFTVGPAVLVCLGILRETPASAMRPLAPRPGKRIILEKIKPLWRRLSFLHKITARNLLRYKKRAFMTVFGVAGCTALLFTGFGLDNSLTTISPKQYEQIMAYDVAITFKPKAEEGALNELYSFIEESPELSSTTFIRREIVNIETDATTKDLGLIVFENAAELSGFYQLSPRKSNPLSETSAYQLDDTGVVITEQIARQTGVVVGDTITLRGINDDGAQFVVSGICENYVYHYVFMTTAAFEEGFGRLFEPNQILGVMSSGSIEMPESLTALEAVSGVTYTQKMADDFSSITDVLGFVMVILILSAAVLLFVVLFSLNTINREERARELASIKVLGFFNRELAAYIYREGFILTIIGIAFGIILGIGLERYLITIIEIDVFMFSRDILFTSYLYSVALTALFALVINLLLYRSLTQIDMVAALKAIE